eukprot:CAMPEP_0119260074 /NCGR_PEP_ID=MMETSP1329-20130426/633_1 /TAXON_ID=114041 /ORGANISM="Genus nov. species nov., Strain RCC1024" /LENGTH=457 /DNA_ID=CAMNT_0007259489 /DNA_START=45 /DNA_END=1418 /DNA_ORIENTATION=+
MPSKLLAATCLLASAAALKAPTRLSKYVSPAQAVAAGGAVEGSKSSVTTSTLNLAKNIVGSGVLALPAGVAACSTARKASLPACGLIAVLGAISAYCFALVGRACEATGTNSYRTAWEASVGEGTGSLITGITSFKTLVGCISYCIIIGDTATALAASTALPALLKRRDVLLPLIGGGFLFPLSMLRDMKALAPASIIGLSGMLYTAGVCVWRALDGSYVVGKGRHALALAASGSALPSFGAGASAGGALLFVSMLATSYLAHYNAAAYYVELERPTLARYNRVVYGGFAIAVAFFCSLTAAAHATFGKASAGFILNSFAATDAFANAARALVGLAVACTYPLLFKGARDGFFELTKASPKAQEDLRTPITVALTALSVLAGIVVTDLGFVVAFGGAVLGSAIIYILPTQIALAAAKKGKLALSGAEKKVCQGVRAMGYVLGALGATASVLSRMGKI